MMAPAAAPAVALRRHLAMILASRTVVMATAAAAVARHLTIAALHGRHQQALLVSLSATPNDDLQRLLELLSRNSPARNVNV